MAGQRDRGRSLPAEVNGHYRAGWEAVLQDFRNLVTPSSAETLLYESALVLDRGAAAAVKAILLR